MRSIYETPESVSDPVRLEAVRAGVALISYASVAIDHIQSIEPTRVGCFHTVVQIIACVVLATWDFISQARAGAQSH